MPSASMLFWSPTPTTSTNPSRQTPLSRRCARSCGGKASGDTFCTPETGHPGHPATEGARGAARAITRVDRTAVTPCHTCVKFAPARGFLYYSMVTLGDRLVVGRRTLDPSTQVRILVPQPILLVRSSSPMAWTRQGEGEGHAESIKPAAAW